MCQDIGPHVHFTFLEVFHQAFSLQFYSTVGVGLFICVCVCVCVCVCSGFVGGVCGVCVGVRGVCV